MEAGFALANATLAWLVTYVLVGSSTDGRRNKPTGWARGRAIAVMASICERLGHTTAIRGLERVASWSSLADELAERAQAWSLRMAHDAWCAAAFIAAVCLVCALGLVAWSPLGIVVGVIVVVLGVPLWDSSRRRERERELVDEMPGVFRTLAMALGAGETLAQAVEYVGIHERGYAGRAFSDAAMRMRCGMSAEEAMNQLANELDAPGVELLTTALVIAQRTGSPLRELFQKSARLVERQGELDRLLSVKTAQVRLSVRIVVLLPLAMVCLLSLLSPDFQRGMASGVGMGCIVVAALMDGCAVLAIRRLMKGVI